MKSLFLVALVAVSPSGAAGAQTSVQPYPSCDLPARRVLKGETDGRIREAGQAHISMRGNILEADLSSARKAGRLRQVQADGLFRRVGNVCKATDRFVAGQGFLSAAGRASFDRDLDAVATRICHP